MSGNHKLKKYLNKIEATNDLAKMDEYYEKVKQYKMGQNGGGNPWRTDLKDKVDLLDKVGAAQASLDAYIGTKKAEIDKVSGSLEDFKKKYKTVEEDFTDALLYLKEVTDKIKESGALDSSGLDGLFGQVTGIVPQNSVDADLLWELINKSQFNKGEIQRILQISDPTKRADEIQNIKDAKNPVAAAPAP